MVSVASSELPDVSEFSTETMWCSSLSRPGTGPLHSASESIIFFPRKGHELCDKSKHGSSIRAEAGELCINVNTPRTNSAT